MHHSLYVAVKNKLDVVQQRVRQGRVVVQIGFQLTIPVRDDDVADDFAEELGRFGFAVCYCHERVLQLLS